MCCVRYIVYIDLLSCVLFSPAAASLAPTEQLVLTTIRQEASELQDPGQGTGATMRARLADRFDKSEFARIGLDDAQFVSQVFQSACVATPCATSSRSSRLTKPLALMSYKVQLLNVSGSRLKRLKLTHILFPLSTLKNL